MNYGYDMNFEKIQRQIEWHCIDKNSEEWIQKENIISYPFIIIIIQIQMRSVHVSPFKECIAENGSIIVLTSRSVPI